jgi:hemerythrin superfamily protein
MDVYQILIQDHRAITKMFEELEKTGNMEIDRRQRLFSDLSAALENHEIIEENDFMPELLDASSFSNDATKNATIKELVAEIFDDHADFEAISQQISNSRADDDRWLERVSELRALVREHVRAEEERLFPAAQQVLDQERSEEIGRQIEARRQREA